MIGHAIFDLDGTLLDSAELCAGIISAMHAGRGSPARVTGQQARQHVSSGAERMLAALLGDAQGDPDLDLVEFRDRYRELPTPRSSLFPGVEEGLARLRRAGVGLALCSNKPQSLCDKVVVELGLVEYFQAVVGGTPGLPSKPDPAHLHRALTLANGARERCCYVGDSEVDYVAAQRANIPFIMVTYGYGEAGFEPAGVLSADHFAATPSIIERLLGQRRGGVA